MACFVAVAMGKNTLQGLVRRSLNSVEETKDDIVAIRISDGVGYNIDRSREVVFGELDQYRGDTGFGTENLPNIYVWTTDHVHIKEHYDGQEAVRAVPRNPSEQDVQSYGGG